MPRANRASKLAAICTLALLFSFPAVGAQALEAARADAESASAESASAESASAESECAHEDNPRKCLRELAAENNDDSDESDDESDDSEDDSSSWSGNSSDSGDDSSSSDNSTDNSSSDDNSDDTGDDSGDDSGSDEGETHSGVDSDHDKDHSIPTRIIKPGTGSSGSGSSGSSTSGNSMGSGSRPSKHPAPGPRPPKPVSVEEYEWFLPTLITTEITTERASLLRTALSTTSSSNLSNDDYLPRIGSIGAHDARRAGSGSVIAATLAEQAERIHLLRDAVMPVEYMQNPEGDSLVKVFKQADFSDPAQEFMAKATFGAAVLAAGGVALAANAFKNRRKVVGESETEAESEYDYRSGN